MNTYLEKVKSVDEYMVPSSIYEIEEGKKRVIVVARVPNDRFDDCLSFIKSTCGEI